MSVTGGVPRAGVWEPSQGQQGGERQTEPCLSCLMNTANEAGVVVWGGRRQAMNETHGLEQKAGDGIPAVDEGRKGMCV